MPRTPYFYVDVTELLCWTMPINVLEVKSIINRANDQPSRGKHLEKQGKIGRPRSESPMVHTAIALPRDLLDRLKADAAASGEGLSTAIRRRLQVVDSLRRRSAETQDLIWMTEGLADSLAHDVGAEWHEHAYAMAAFKAGLLALLAQYKPQGDASVRPTVGAFGEPNDPPEIVGRMHANKVWDLLCDWKNESV
jgi:hypothetical protein